MAYFPFFMDIEGKNCLIVGGGKVALRKAEKLLPYGPVIHLVSPVFAEEFYAMPALRLNVGEFQPDMLENMSFVIAATGNSSLNHKISALCRARNIPVNVVDDKDACSFIFPALVKRGALSVGISTGGASPSAAIYLKERINALLPDRLDEILSFLDAARLPIKAAFPLEEDRSAAFKELFLLCMEQNAPLTADSFRAFLAERGQGQNG